MEALLQKIQESNQKQAGQIRNLNESVSTIYKKVDSTDSTIQRLYKEQVNANKMAALMAKRAAADAKRRQADNPLKKMAENNNKEQKKGNGLLEKLLAALAGLGGLSAVITGSLGGLKELVVNALKDAFRSLFGPKGFLRSALKAIFGKEGFLRKTLSNLFGKDSFLRKGLAKIFGKEGFLRKSIGKIFGKEGFLRKSIGKAFAKLGKLLPKGLKDLAKNLSPVLKLLANFAKGGTKAVAKGAAGLAKAGLKGAGALAKGGAKMALKGAGGLANFALKRGPFAALFAAGDELLGEDPKLGRATARGGGAAAGAITGGAIGSIVPVVGTAIGSAIGAGLGDFLGGFLYDTFPDIFKPLDDFGVQIGEKFNQIKDGFTNWWDGISKKFIEIKTGFTNWWSGVTTRFTEVKDGIVKLWTDVSTTVTNVASTIGSVLEVITRPYREFLGEAVRLGKNLFKIGTDLVTRYVKFLNTIRVNITDFVGGFFKKLTDFGGKVIGFVDNNIVKPIGDKFNQLSKFLKPVTDLLGRLAGGILDKVVGVFNKISGFFGEGGAGGAVLETVSNLNPLNLLTNTLGKLNDTLEGKQTGGVVGPTYLQGGGPFTVPGHGSGDKVPMMLPTGSFVLNRNASQQLQYGGAVLEPGETVWPAATTGLMEMNRNVGRFQSGGIVEANHPDTGPGWSVGKDSQQRPSVFTKTAAEAFVKAMKDSDGAVKTSDITSSQRSKRKNDSLSGASPTSNHLKGLAVDIHGTSKAWLKANGPDYGWKNLVYSGHDGHFDFTKGMGGYNADQGDGKEKTADGDGIGLKIESKTGGLGGGPAGLLGGAMSWLGNLIMQGSFEEGYLGRAKEGGLAMQLYDLIKSQKKEQSFDISMGGSGSKNASAGAASINDPNARALLNAIAIAEGTANKPNRGYLTHFGGSQYTGSGYPSDHPRKDTGGSDAFGRYQFMSPTWAEYANGRDMSPEGQDAVALDLVGVKRGVDLSDGLSKSEVQSLAWEWASIKGNNYTYKGRSQGKVGQDAFLKMYEEQGGMIQKKQKGGQVTPVLLEPGEKVFAPGTWGSGVENLNNNVPRFQTGGAVGMKGTTKENSWIDSSMNMSSSPQIIVVQQQSPAVQAPEVSAPGVSNDVPGLASTSSSPISALLQTQNHLLAERIG